MRSSPRSPATPVGDRRDALAALVGIALVAAVVADLVVAAPLDLGWSPSW